MKIEKIYSSNIPTGKVLNYKSDSLEDTYSCKYINDNIRKLEVLPEGTNIDNLTETYLNNTVAIFNATGTLPLGYSTSDNNIILTTTLWGNDYGRQICQDVKTKRTSIRNLNNGVWLPWIDVDDNYSTEERCIGTWIDGKPIYRKVFVGNWISDTLVWTNLVKGNISNCNTVVSIKGIIKNPNNGDNIPIPSYETTNYFANIMYNQSDDYIKCFFKGWTYNAFKMMYIIVLEYTKTTD